MLTQMQPERQECNTANILKQHRLSCVCRHTGFRQLLLTITTTTDVVDDNVDDDDFFIVFLHRL